MKKMIFIMSVVFVSITTQLNAQFAVIDPSNLAQNILTVARTSTTAANMIKNVEETVKIYKQGKEYYDALKSVHDLIKDARKVKETVELLSEITSIYVTNFNKMLSDPNFSVDELAAISNGYTKLLKEGGNLLSDIKQVVSSSNGLSMTDAERMSLIDKIHLEMRDYRNLVLYFTNKNISVSFLRAQKVNDADRVVALYGNANDRYW